MKQLAAFLLAIVPLLAMAAPSNYPLEKFRGDLRDQASLQRGAQLYMNYCMGCHGLQFERYEKVAQGIGVPEELFMDFLVFDRDHRIGDRMENAMPSDLARRWFGANPPDLTLIARSRGTDWLYTYMKTFYYDPARPYGVNNKVFPDVGMPHALVELQGLQACAPGSARAANGGVRRDPMSGDELLYGDDGEPLNPCGRFEIVTPGKLSPAEYDQAVTDLVNFLEYVGEPVKLTRQRLGIYVLMFLAVFFVFTWLLNREYWKDVH